MNKRVKLVLHIIGLSVVSFVAFYLFTGNGIFDAVYMWWSGLQLIFIVLAVLAIPYYVRYIIRLI